MAVCMVCCELFTKQRRKPIDCHACDFSVCRECVQTYLSQSVNEPQCMSCHKLWNTSYIIEKMTKSFINSSFKEHRQTVLWEAEVSKMPQAQAVLENRREAEEIRAEIKKIYKKYLRAVNPLHEKLDALRSTKKVAARKFIRGCVGENCKGFLSTQWKCGVCEKQTCKDCLLYILDEDKTNHVCNQDDVETAKTLAKDTKSCPSCGIMITKIDGCDQMWCSECHSAFSWKSGEIETGNVHNPHYFAFLRSQSTDGIIPRTPDERDCNVAPDLALVVNISNNISQLKISDVNNVHGLKDIDMEFISRLTLLSTHIHFVELRNRFSTETKDNLETRIQYLTNKIDIGLYKNLIYKQDKERVKRLENRAILEMLKNIVNENLHHMLSDPIVETYKNTYKRLTELIDYVNSSFEKISNIHSGVKLEINETVSLKYGARFLYQQRPIAVRRRH